MSEQELNKKMVEFGGFKLQAIWSSYVDLRTVLKWTFPDGTYHREAPNFPQSLDAIFKWLVPKISKTNEVQILIPPDTEGRFIAIIGHQEGIEAQTPALALCKAIEKLIDEP